MPDDNLSGISCLSGWTLLMFVLSPTIVNMKYGLFLCFMLSFAGISARENFRKQETEADSTVRTKTGYATYYARKFEGRKTTSGVRYRASKMTAAHLSLPFGTVVKVTNLSNGKSVDVKVNDRGPHSRKYIIDLSAGAAKKLGFYRMGHSKVEISYQLHRE